MKLSVIPSLTAASILALTLASGAELPGAAAAAPEPDPVASLSGSRVLLVFAANADAPELRRQIALLNAHNYEMAADNVVIVPVAAGAKQDAFTGENLMAATENQQARDRERFHVADGQFAVVLLDANGQELQRWSTPVSEEEISAKLPAVETRTKHHKRFLFL